MWDIFDATNASLYDFDATSVLVVLGWATYDEIEKNLDETITLTPNKNMKITLRNHATANLLLSGYVESNTSISEISAEVYLEN